MLGGREVEANQVLVDVRVVITKPQYFRTKDVGLPCLTLRLVVYCMQIQHN